MEGPADQAMWRCPDCGQRFVGRNMPHSCALRDLDEHFAAAAPGLRAVFDALLTAVRAGGPVTVNATRSRVTFQTRIRFAGIDAPRGDHLLANFVLTRPVRSERIARVEHVPPYYYVHRVRLTRPEDVDADLRAWLAEARQVGDRRHVTDPDWPREREPPDWVRVPRPR
jgi:Domain of unknown function (DUF5655)